MNWRGEKGKVSGFWSFSDITTASLRFSTICTENLKVKLSEKKQFEELLCILTAFLIHMLLEDLKAISICPTEDLYLCRTDKLNLCSTIQQMTNKVYWAVDKITILKHQPINVYSELSSTELTSVNLQIRMFIGYLELKYQNFQTKIQISTWSFLKNLLHYIVYVRVI